MNKERSNIVKMRYLEESYHFKIFMFTVTLQLKFTVNSIPMFSQPSTTHLQNCGLDPHLLKERIGYGAGHVVYKYGKNHVVKIPRFQRAKHHFSLITAEDAQKYLLYVREHFSLYIPETSVHCSTRSQSYCLVQEWLSSPKNLRASDITEHEEIAKQFSDILTRNQNLIQKEGLSLDFFGQEGFIKTVLSAVHLSHPQMANLVVCTQDGQSRICILDSQLFEIRKPENAKLARKMMAEATRWSFELSRVFAKGGFGRDL
jgi:hypothetical protein